MLNRQQKRFVEHQKFIEKAETIRVAHPEMGCRKMALKLKEKGFGRDKIEELLLQSGFRVIYPPNYTRTTQSVRIHQYKNLIKGLPVKGINKVAQTDITYFWMNGRFGYLIFIIDVYSRLIIGYHASMGLESEANIKALEMMIKCRGKENLKGLIHHSDRGSQYHSTEYLKILKDCGIKISMCDAAWENAYTERINRTIKNEYLRHRKIDSLKKLKRQLDIDIKAYNTDRPHRSLPQQMAPAIFEQYVSRLKRSGRPKMTIYDQVKQKATNEFFLAMKQSDNKIAAGI
jgi:transposase InsO family protein